MSIIQCQQNAELRERIESGPSHSIRKNVMTVKAFADTNLFVYAQAKDNGRSSKARAIIERGPVISVQVINETVNAPIL
jgi:hypothetical protein